MCRSVSSAEIMRHVIVETLEALVRTDGEGSNPRQSKFSSTGTVRHFFSGNI